MTLFDDRERAFEAKFRGDQETAFRIAVRRDKLLGLWAAEELGLSGDAAKAYAQAVVAAGLERHDARGNVVGDLLARGSVLAETTVRLRHDVLHERAREQVFAESAAG